MKTTLLPALLLTTLLLLPVAYAAPAQPAQEEPLASPVLKFIAAAIAFISAVFAAGWAISRAGTAGLAASAERPEVRTTAIIIAAFGEALAIYGIVVAFFILGA